MAPGYIPVNPTPHVRSRPGNVLEFSLDAMEIVLLDRRGKTVWRQMKRSAEEAIMWQGLDQYGNKVDNGHYVLRINYPSQPPVYVPFIVM